MTADKIRIVIEIDDVTAAYLEHMKKTTGASKSRQIIEALRLKQQHDKLTVALNPVLAELLVSFVNQQDVDVP